LEFANKYGDNIRIIDQIKDVLLEGRYLIQEKLTEGAYGMIYKGVDMLSPIESMNKFTYNSSI
jgi:hypothetical protein|tara:strand:+ start:183 stop:371 length:189 start_codon:yes stop_codon:yes gene_type:complete